MKKKCLVALVGLGIGLSSLHSLAAYDCDGQRQACMERGYGLTYCNDEYYRCIGWG